VVDVEQGALAALEQHDLVLVERVVEDQRGVGDVRLDLLRVLEHLLHDRGGLDRAAVVELREELVLAFEGRFDLLGEDRLVVEVLDPDADAVDLVGVGRADAAAGRADLALAEEALADLVEGDVVRRDEVRVAADQQLGGVDAALVQAAQLGEQDGRVDDDAVADDRGASGGEDAGREKVQCVLLVAYDDRVAGVVAALVAHHIVNGSTEQVGGLSLALVTPLSSEQHKSGHRRTPLPDGACPRPGGVRRCTPQAEPSDRYPGIDEGPGAIAQGPLAQRCYPRKDRGVGSRAHHEPCGRAGRRTARARRPGRPPS
jgi:hypothetical protein